jgi:REP element-mobilizing transposase RayT
MPDKFKDKYKILSNRLRGWDYACNGHYYITIVTADRKRLFGEIVDGEMVLNDWGQIVYDEFFKSFEMRSELFLGEFVLMPDHLHAIVILDKTKCMDVGAWGDELYGDGSFGDVAHDQVETHGRASLPQTRQSQPQQSQPTPTMIPTPQRTCAPTSMTSPQFQRQPKSISSFVAGFKSATVKRIDDWIDAHQPTMAKFNKNNPLWQSNYHDHIIRDVIEYQYIAEYIVRNPIEWRENESNEE